MNMQSPMSLYKHASEAARNTTTASPSGQYDSTQFIPALDLAKKKGARPVKCLNE